MVRLTQGILSAVADTLYTAECMQTRHHLKLLLQALAVWFAFWVLGWPDYYQQYSPTLVGIGSVLLSVGISLAALLVLSRARPEQRRSRAFWLSLYFTLPLAILDSWYCGIWLGHGVTYLWTYWYLSVFYLTPWLTFIPTAWLLNRDAPARTQHGKLPGR